MWQVVIDISDAVRKLESAEAVLTDTTAMNQAIAQDLESVTEANFAAQGRPSWAPLSKATIRARQKRNKGSSTLQMLQDRGILAASVSSAYGSDYALIGAGGAAADYAAAQQYGADITVPARSSKVRLRTTAKGNLLRQAANRNLAVFARDSHQRARESWHEVGEYTIKIPARPYLPFKGQPGSEVLQPEARDAILATVQQMLERAFR